VTRLQLPRVRRSLSASLLVFASFAFTGLAFAQATPDPSSSAGTAAQEPADPNPGAISTSGGLDFQSTYMFRGIRQNSTGVAAWPWVDLGFAAYEGDGAVKGVTVNLGSWNSHHTGDTGADGPSQKLWYESDFYTTVGIGFGGGVALATTYTAYTSPNNTFTTVKEIMVKLAVDDRARFGKASFKPYAIVARELDAAPGTGQADGGLKAGTYFELGVAPGLAFPKASLAVPVKVGLSLGNYYEVDGVDETFGFVSLSGILTVPLGTTSYGSWHIHGGVEYQKLGAHTGYFNGDDRSRVIGSIGFGFAY
jgi:hypothetical protein